MLTTAHAHRKREGWEVFYERRERKKNGERIIEVTREEKGKDTKFNGDTVYEQFKHGVIA